MEGKKRKVKVPLKWKVLTVISWVLALVTVIPAPARKLCLLGYRAVCPCAPASTLILLVLGFGFLAIGMKRRRPREERV